MSPSVELRAEDANAKQKCHGAGLHFGVELKGAGPNQRAPPCSYDTGVEGILRLAGGNSAPGLQTDFLRNDVRSWNARPGFEDVDDPQVNFPHEPRHPPNYRR